MTSIKGIKAQNGIDSILNGYSFKITGTWVRQNNVIDGRDRQKDTLVMVCDTLRFWNNNTYFSRQGSNLNKKTIGIIDKGIWNIEAEINPNKVKEIKAVLRLKPTYSNLPLPLVNYNYSIIVITATELSFYYYDRIHKYHKVDLQK